MIDIGEKSIIRRITNFTVSNFSNFVLPVAFFSLFLIINSNNINIFYDEIEDNAINALQIIRATHFEEYLGPYSRYGFHHLGPVSFYYFSFTESLFFFLKSDFSKHIVAQLLSNLIFLIISLSILKKEIKKHLITILYFGLLLACLAPLGNAVLLDLWGPSLLIFPAGAFILSSVQLSLSKIKYFPIMSISGLIMIHNHLSSVLFVGVLSLLALFFYYSKSKNSINKRDWLYLGISIAIILITLVPIIYDTLKNSGGNIRKLWEFYSVQPAFNQSFMEVLQYIAKFYYIPVEKYIAVPSWLFLLIIFLLSAVNLNSKNKFIKNMVIFNFVGFAVTLVAALKIIGPLYDFLFYYEYVLASFIYFLSILGFGKISVPIYQKIGINKIIIKKQYSKYLHFSTLILILVILPMFVNRYYKIDPYPKNEVIKVLYNKLVTKGQVLFELTWEINGTHHEQWRVAAGLALKLIRNKYNVCVPDEWTFMFGDNMKCAPKKSTYKIRLFDKSKYNPDIDPRFSEMVTYKNTKIGFGVPLFDEK